MASTLAPKIQTFACDAAITKGMAIKKGTDKDHVAKGAANTDKVFGAALNTTTKAEDACEVGVIGGGASVLLGETVTAGAYLVSHTDGTWVKANAAGDHVGAIAMEGGDSGALIDAIIVCFEAYNAE
jgi:hypothetical protein